MKSSQKEASGKEPVAKSMEQRAKRLCASEPLIEHR